MAIADALTVNTSLTKLWFPSNFVGSKGLIAFGALLPKMKGLEELHVGDVFETVAVDALIRGLGANTTVTQLYTESPLYNELYRNEEKLDYLLPLNKSGRELVHTSKAFPPGLWCTALEKVNRHLHKNGCPDVMFYMLGENPDSFCLQRDA